MNVKYSLHNIAFEWDSTKAAANVRRHSIAFELACEAFFDPFVCHFDEEIVGGEHRETIIGLATTWQLVYVLRADIIRIISARLATNAEKDTYENQ